MTMVLFEFSHWRLRLEIDLEPLLMLKSCQWVVVVVVHLDYSISSGPFLSFEIDPDLKPFLVVDLDNTHSFQ